MYLNVQFYVTIYKRANTNKQRKLINGQYLQYWIPEEIINTRIFISLSSYMFYITIGIGMLKKLGIKLQILKSFETLGLSVG